MNRFESRILDQIRRRGDGVEGHRVLVACSGGADSVALLALLWRIRPALDLDLIVAHLDHQLRPESAREAAFVQELCRGLDLDLVEGRLGVREHAEATGQGLETAARELRWQWFTAEAASSGAELVATGHHLDDHTETVLLRLARGGGSGCLTPLPARQGLRWSPLIQATRAELRAYLGQLKLGWCEDASNAEPFTQRNRLRALLSPLREEAPGLDRNLWETHRQVAELETWRDALVQGWRPERWNLAGRALELRGPWEELELRWVLAAAFTILGYEPEAALLRDLAPWLRERMGRKHRRAAEWGSWALLPEPMGWRLHPKVTSRTAEAG